MPTGAVKQASWCRTCVELPVWRRRAWRRSLTRNDGTPEQHAPSWRARPRHRLAVERARRGGAAHRYRRIEVLLGRPTLPMPRVRPAVPLGSWSWRPPPFEELGSCRHGVDHCGPLLIIDDSDIERFCIHGRTDVRGDSRVVGLEREPVVAECMEHVVVGDTVPAGARFDVDRFGTVPAVTPTSTYVDEADTHLGVGRVAHDAGRVRHGWPRPSDRTLLRLQVEYRSGSGLDDASERSMGAEAVLADADS